MKNIHLLVVLIVGMTALMSAQVDTLVVPDEIGGVKLGAINITIEGDTTATGERNNPDRVYKLQADKIYLLNGPLTQTQNYHLKLIGEEPTPANRPALIMPGIRSDGSIADNLMVLNNDFTLKNIYFMGMATDGQVHSNENMASVYGNNINAVIENCIIEQNKVICFGFYGDYPNVKAQNNLIRNSHQEGVGHWNGGRFIWTWDNPGGNIELVNNTWVNTSAYFYTDRDRGTENIKIEHNTFVNSCAFVFFLHKMTNASISNNVFYNCQFTGEMNDEYYQGWNDYDGAIASVISIDTLFGNKGAFKLDSTWATTNREAERNIKVKNNSYYVDPLITAAWAEGIDSGWIAVGTEWMNTRTQGMFNDNTTWPGLEESGNLMNADPVFEVNPTVMDSILAFIPILATWGATPSWAYPVDGKPKYIPDWPIPEDLSYTNASMIHGGSDGFAIGDLNWFPDQLAIWITDVEENNIDDLIPEEYSLSQNYPNPFNPSTTINYSVPAASFVNISIFNTLGQKVTELVNQEINPGNYQVVFEAKNLASGLYFYSIKADKISITKKMLLLK
jgi:hypothetical protein